MIIIIATTGQATYTRDQMLQKGIDMWSSGRADLRGVPEEQQEQKLVDIGRAELERLTEQQPTFDPIEEGLDFEADIDDDFEYQPQQVQPKQQPATPQQVPASSPESRDELDQVAWQLYNAYKATDNEDEKQDIIEKLLSLRYGKGTIRSYMERVIARARRDGPLPKTAPEDPMEWISKVLEEIPVRDSVIGAIATLSQRFKHSVKPWVNRYDEFTTKEGTQGAQSITVDESQMPEHLRGDEGMEWAYKVLRARAMSSELGKGQFYGVPWQGRQLAPLLRRYSTWEDLRRSGDPEALKVQSALESLELSEAYRWKNWEQEGGHAAGDPQQRPAGMEGTRTYAALDHLERSYDAIAKRTDLDPISLKKRTVYDPLDPRLAGGGEDARPLQSYYMEGQEGAVKKMLQAIQGYLYSAESAGQEQALETEINQELQSQGKPPISLKAEDWANGGRYHVMLEMLGGSKYGTDPIGAYKLLHGEGKRPGMISLHGHDEQKTEIGTNQVAAPADAPQLTKKPNIKKIMTSPASAATSPALNSAVEEVLKDEQDYDYSISSTTGESESSFHRVVQEVAGNIARNVKELLSQYSGPNSAPPVVYFDLKNMLDMPLPRKASEPEARAAWGTALKGMVQLMLEPEADPVEALETELKEHQGFPVDSVWLEDGGRRLGIEISGTSENPMQSRGAIQKYVAALAHKPAGVGYDMAEKARNEMAENWQSYQNKQSALQSLKYDWAQQKAKREAFEAMGGAKDHPDVAEKVEEVLGAMKAAKHLGNYQQFETAMSSMGLESELSPSQIAQQFAEIPGQDDHAQAMNAKNAIAALISEQLKRGAKNVSMEPIENFMLSPGSPYNKWLAAQRNILSRSERAQAGNRHVLYRMVYDLIGEMLVSLSKGQNVQAGILQSLRLLKVAVASRLAEGVSQ